MDWSLFFDHYVQVFSDVLYWSLMILWVSLPFAAVAVLVYAAYRFGQSMQPSARIEKELQAMLEKENHNGR